VIHRIPRTPAGRTALVMELCAPQYQEGEDDNGDPIIKTGEPLISKEDAFKLLEFPDLDEVAVQPMLDPLSCFGGLPVIREREFTTMSEARRLQIQHEMAVAETVLHYQLADYGYGGRTGYLVDGAEGWDANGAPL
jgi:hypothetical protein